MYIMVEHVCIQFKLTYCYNVAAAVSSSDSVGTPYGIEVNGYFLIINSSVQCHDK